MFRQDILYGLCAVLLMLSRFVSAQDTCNIGGVVYQRGEHVRGAFETRCGLWSDFPCFCNPDAREQVECPYCGFATSTPNLLRCANHMQEITLVDLDGVGQRCTCDASDPLDPKGSCTPDPSAEFCTIQLDDGSTITRQFGEEIGRESRCGTTLEYPCLCNPNLGGQIDCPYCSYASLDEGLVCLSEGQIKTFVDLNGMTRTCGCQAGRSPNFPMNPVGCVDVPTLPPQLEECEFTDENGQITKFANGASLGDFYTHVCGPPSAWPCFCNTQLDDQIECPYCSVQMDEDNGASNYLCGADLDMLNVPQSDGTTAECQCRVGSPFGGPRVVCDGLPTLPPGCTVDLPNGQKTTIAADAAVPNRSGPCGSATDYPYICRPGSSNADNVVYPYCQFEKQGGGAKVCEKDGGTVQFVAPGGTEQRCDCIYVSDSVGPQSSCKPIPGHNKLDGTDSPTVTPVTVKGSGSRRTMVDTGWLPSTIALVAVLWLWQC